MELRALSVDRFRNLVPAHLEPGPRFNVISGENGQGKTNLLEAIYLAGTLRSFRASRNDEMISWGESGCEVRARVVKDGLERVYRVALGGARRVVELDGKVPRSLGDYFGDFNVVLFAPEDLRVPRGGPAHRRRFLDRSVFNRRPAFLEDAQRYVRILKNRNAHLRDGKIDEALLDVYDEQLVAAGNAVSAARRSYLAELEPRFAAGYREITDSGIAAGLAYRAHDEDLASALRDGRRRDLARRQTGSGPHVDDVDFLLDGRVARAFASQGQLRALVLAWKTAEMQLLRDVHGDPPVLLLDDVSSELDPKRSALLFERLTRIECQSFITTTHPRHVQVLENRQDFLAVRGVIAPC